MLAQTVPALADPLSGQEIKAVNQFPNWVADACSSTGSGGSVEPGNGAPDGAAFPNLNPDAMATSIDNYIKKVNPNSKLSGLGSTIVASAEHSNVSPFLIVAIAQKESTLADPSVFNVAVGNNAFGRMAAAGQPSFQGSRPWYKWSSVKASVDYTAPENQNKKDGDMASYLREVYGDSIDKSDLTSLFMKYAPPVENDTSTYIAQVKGWVSEMVKGAGASAGDTTISSGGSSSCCPTGNQSITSTDGTNSAGNEYVYLVGKGLKPIVAAAITGNNIWESGGSLTKLTLVPSQVNDIGAIGIAQWYQGRADDLHKFAQEQGKPWDDLGLQLDYLWKELSGPYSSALDATKAQSSIELATTTFEAKFEVSGDSGSYPERIAAAKRVLQKFGGGGVALSDDSGGTCPGSDASSIDGYKNPLRDVKNLVPMRIDMGVDYGGSGPVYAIGNGTVANLTNSGWPGGTFISYKLADGPAQGKYVYFAENCKNIRVHVGQQVTSNTVLCDMIDAYPHIETGWAEPPGLGDTVAIHNGGYTEGSATAAGENFNQLLIKLGAPSGTQQPKMGSLPSGWPTW